MAKDKYKAVKELAAASGVVLTDEQAQAISAYFAKAPKEQTRNKTFRFPAELLDWLERQATEKGRSPNAELIELIRHAKAAE